MKAKEYIAAGGEPEDIIVKMNEEFFHLRQVRAITTQGGIVPLYKEFDAKWRIIATALFPEHLDLFESAFLATYPEIAQAVFSLRIARLSTPIRSR